MTAKSKRSSPTATPSTAAAESDPRYPPPKSRAPASSATKSAAQPSTQHDSATKKASDSPAARPDPGKPKQTVDAMLPPGASVASKPSSKKESGADTLLPPGAEVEAGDSAVQQRALPESEEDRPAKVDKNIVISTEDGDTVTLHEPERVIGEGAKTVRLRTLSSEEKTRKRSLKSLIVWLLCVVVLVVAMALLLKK